MALARDRLGSSELAWQYLEKAHQRSPGDPLLLPDLIALAEAQGRYEQLSDLLAQMEESHRISHGEDPPPLGLWLKRAVTLRLAGQDALADELESRIATQIPTHLLLLLARQRRAMRQGDFAGLLRLFRDEGQLAQKGLSDRKDAPEKSDTQWAVDAYLVAATTALRSSNLTAAQELLDAARALLADKPAASQHQQVQDLAEELFVRSQRLRELAAQYEGRLATGLWTSAPVEAQRLHELLVDLYGGPLADAARAMTLLEPLVAAAPDDLRLRRLAVILRRRSGDVAGEAAALAELARIEQKLGLGESLPADLLRRAELLAQSGDEAAAVAIYEQVLRIQPGEPQALDAIEQLLRRSGRGAELAQVLRRQIELAQTQLQRPGGERSGLSQRLLLLQASLTDLLENELGQPGQAAAVYRAVIGQRSEYVPPLWALERLYRRQKDGAQQAQVLEQLAEMLPTGPTRAALWTRLGDLRQRQPAGRPQEAEAAYQRSFQSMPLPSPVAAHAVLGRQQALLAARALPKLGEVYEAWQDTLAPDEPLRSSCNAVFTEERAHWSSLSATTTALERSDALLGKALQDLRQDEESSKQAPELIPLLEWSRYQLACRRGDGKQQGVALAGLAAYLTPRADAQTKTSVGEIWLRAGLLAALNEDEHSQKIEAARRLLQAYRLLGDAPQVLVPLCDLLEDAAIAEALVREPEIIPVLRARQALAAEGETEDRLLWTLMEAEIWLQRGEGDEVDAATRTRCSQEAAEAALRGLILDGESIWALWLLRQATSPGDPRGADIGQSSGLSSEEVARFRGYGLYTLRLASLLSTAETKAELYAEAAQVFVKLGDLETAAAALRAVLDCAPFDDAAFSQLRGLLTSRAEDPKKPDAGPLLELLNFRLALAPEDEASARAEQSLRVSLLLSRAALLQGAGQLAEAAADLQALLRIDTRQPNAHRRLAELRAQAGDSDAAIHHYEQFLALGGNPADRQAVHIAVARLLSRIDPARTVPHVRQAIELGRKFRELRGDEVDTAEEVAGLVDLHRWLERLHLSLGQPDEAIATLRELDTQIPQDEAFFETRQRVAIAVADVLETHKKDRTAAIASLEQLLLREPLALQAMERLASLTQAAGESQRPQALYRKFIDEARRLTRENISQLEPAKAAPFLALAKIFAWQKAADAQQLAAQAAAVLGKGGVPKAPTPKMLPKPLAAPLKTAAFAADARGVLLELWQEVAETAHRLLVPELKTLGIDPKERLNAKQVPQVWTTVDELVRKFGMGTSDHPYGLYMARDREQCQLVGNSLICGSNFSGTLRDLSSSRFSRLLRRVVLLPDRLGPIDGDLVELTLFITACCQLVGLPGPTISTELKLRLDERLRALDRAIGRRERNGLKNLSTRLTALNGEAGRAMVATWQEEIRIGAAQLALAISGDVQGVLSDLSVSANDGDATSARVARRLLSFSVSEDILTIRRDLGVSE
jgi:tetratricopeptide (TPR) repeat protein